MARNFSKAYLRKEYFVKEKEYKDIKIKQYETGFLVKPDFQPEIAISLSFGVILATLMRDVNGLFVKSEAEEIVKEFTCNNKEGLDERQIIRKIQKKFAR